MAPGARFTFWEGADPDLIAPMVTQWQAAFADFTVIGDADVIPLLEARYSDLAPLYRRQTIPAARSDIARMIWLEAHGGFYVDAHTGLRNANRLRGVLDALPESGVALVEKNPRTARVEGTSGLETARSLPGPGRRSCRPLWTPSRIGFRP